MTSDGAEVTLQTVYAGSFDHPSGHATVTYDHDEAGDLTFDGVYRYGYDAWSRLVEVRNAYREQSGSQNIREGSVVTAMAYDGLGRRIVKPVSNSGHLNATLHSLYDAQSEIEERNGPDLVLRQQVWGLDYIDELVVVSTNLNPQGNWSIVVVERYEYTPYGQRQVYRGSEDDRKAYAPYLASARLGSLGHSLNPFGHQGLKHDEGVGLVYNRARMLHPGLGRFVQRDILEYLDGSSMYQYGRSNPVERLDPSGFLSFRDFREGIDALRDWALTGDIAPPRNISGAARQKYIEEVWDRTNGTLNGLTLNGLGLEDLTGTDYIFDARSREENRCFSQCVGNLLLSLSPLNPSGLALNPLGGGPLITPPQTLDVAPTAPKVLDGLVNGTPFTEPIGDHARTAGFGERASRPSARGLLDPPTSPDRTRRRTRSGRILGDSAEDASFLFGLVQLEECRKKCFCAN